LEEFSYLKGHPTLLPIQMAKVQSEISQYLSLDSLFSESYFLVGYLFRFP